MKVHQALGMVGIRRTLCFIQNCKEEGLGQDMVTDIFNAYHHCIRNKASVLQLPLVDNSP